MKTVSIATAALACLVAFAFPPELSAFQYDTELNRIDSFLQTRTAPFPFSGTVLIAFDGRIAGMFNTIAIVLAGVLLFATFVPA